MENRNKVLHEQIDTLTARTEKLGEYNVDDGNDTVPDGGDGTAIAGTDAAAKHSFVGYQVSAK